MPSTERRRAAPALRRSARLIQSFIPWRSGAENDLRRPPISVAGGAERGALEHGAKPPVDGFGRQRAVLNAGLAARFASERGGVERVVDPVSDPVLDPVLEPVLKPVLEAGDLARACAAADRSGARLDHVILELGLIEEERLLDVIADWLGAPRAASFRTDGSVCQARERLAAAAPAAFWRRKQAAPLGLMDDGAVALAVVDPFDPHLPRVAAFLLQRPVVPHLGAPKTISATLSELFPGEPEATDGASPETLGEAWREVGEGASEADLERLRARSSDAPVVRFVAEAIAAAVAVGASDIHIEAYEAGGRIRFRVDGALRVHRAMPPDLRDLAVSRLKVMAELNMAERRRPQDGRIRVAVRGRNIDLRLSTLPTQFGESAVLRVLDRAQLSLKWEALGFTPDRAARIRALTRRPHGLFLVAGPTGSGKTTTLYTALAHLDRERRAVFTVEDPIEYTLDGVVQTPVRTDLGVGFAEALRAILRQDPDVVMIGEIRDAATTETAIRAALVGRMVVSTVHANSAIGAVDRLVDLGAPPFLLAATLRGVLAQRLAARICGACAGAGCEACGGAGRAGRVMLSELLEVDDGLRRRISEGASSAALLDQARAAGFRPLEDDIAAAQAAGRIDAQTAAALRD